MTREEAKKLLPFLQAFAEGKTIQYKNAGVWVDLDYPRFYPQIEYRIKPKPEPREVWIVFRNDFECCMRCTKEAANLFVASQESEQEYKVVKFREVTDE